MKKKTFIALLILVLIVAGIIPFKQQKTVSIQAQYFIVLQQLFKPKNWKNWQPELKQAWKKDSSQVKINQTTKASAITAPGITFKITNSSGFASVVNKNLYGKNSTYNFIAIPSSRIGISLVIVNQKINLFRLLYNALFRIKTNTDIHFLKNYLEDARLYYGFDIRKTTVTDSNVVVEKKVIAAEKKGFEIAQIKQELNLFIRQHGLKIVQPVIADIRNAGHGSLRVMIGLPVDRQTVSAGKIEFMHLPPHGRMLTGIYTGRYGGRQKLYLAMKTYISDHNLSSPEDPYEKYLDNKIPESDSSFVHLQVNFPIY